MKGACFLPAIVDVNLYFSNNYMQLGVLKSIYNLSIILQFYLTVLKGKMWEADPELVLVGVGSIDTINTAFDPDSKERNRTWSRGTLEDSVDRMSLLSEHFYSGRVPWNQEGRKPVFEHMKMAKNAIRERVEAHGKRKASIRSL